MTVVFTASFVFPSAHFLSSTVFFSSLGIPLYFPIKAQLIHDRNTASHSTTSEGSAGTSLQDRVHMTWTKDKLSQERNRQKEGMGVKDMFNMKP